MRRVEILREAFMNIDRVFESHHELGSYLVGCSDNQTGMTVKVFLKLESGSIEDAKYQVLGCPHMIGLTSMLTNEIVGQEVNALKGYDYLSLAAAIDLPKNKKDRLFLLEDAVKDCIKHIGKG
jgi:NifU-like protein involved in Fe-S cluster formation